MSDPKPKSGLAAISLYIFGGLLFFTCVGLAYHLWASRKVNLAHEEQSRATALDAGPRVAVVTVDQSPRGRVISLLGEARPFVSATLYAKVSGYLKEINVDKGDRVKTDQLLAVIESPELDHQYQAGVADAKNKRLNADRARTLAKRDMISQQDADTAEADADVAEANVRALAAQKSYEVIRAPFAGVVVARYADPGALVQNAATSQTSTLPLVTVAQTNLLRVYVYPDQRDAHFIRVGDPAVITPPERPELHLNASVTRISGQLDTRTRTMLTEIDFNNTSDVILPGSFVQVSLRVHQAGSGELEIPAESLVMRNEKPFVAVVRPDNTIAFRPVVIGVDEGPHVRIVSGLQKGERIALNLGESLAEGSHIRPVPAGAR
jgi:membrane fusion protein (multidrug efflux system)